MTPPNQSPQESMAKTSSADEQTDLPPLFSDRSFWGLMVTQFLGAFNDNLYKQLMLLLALPAAFAAGTKLVELSKPASQAASATQVASAETKETTSTEKSPLQSPSMDQAASNSGPVHPSDPNNSAVNPSSLPSATIPSSSKSSEVPSKSSEVASKSGDEASKSSDEASDSSSELEKEKAKATEDDVQGWATLVFALPFVLFGGFAGYLSDRFRKTPIILIAKYAEIAIMGLGLAAFLYYNTFGEFGTWAVLFLMGTHSSFFGPSKYGLLPELFQYKDLARANGLMLMSTFLAIILGMVTAGILKKNLDASQLWIGSLVCMGIAVIGTITAHLIRHTPPANPNVKLTLDSWGVSKEMIELFKVDKPLLMAIFVSSVFWLISGLAAPVVNRLGMQQLGVGEVKTSILTASIALGIMGGALAASIICRSRLGKYAVNIGLYGIFLSLVLLGLWSGNAQVLGFQGSLVVLMILGICAAIFSIPVQVFLQSRPPKPLKGRLIATMNQANFVGILLAGPLYQLFVGIANSLGWPISSVFWMMGGLVLPLAIFYRLDTRLSEAEPQAAAA